MKTFFDGPFKNSLFSGKTWKNRTAMVLVPHQDDEINLAGATICNLIDHGIRVYVVFCTTCDRLEPAELRAAEGIRSCRALGVPDQDIIFLGYCNDPHSSPKRHLYNTAGDVVVTSSRNKTETSGTSGKPEWCRLQHQVHHTFTRKNFRDDIADVLTALRPDLVFAVDFDRHPDHRAVSLLFEEAIGIILRRPGNTYFPEIYKGFAYNGSYLGPRDFYSCLNLKGEAGAEGEFSNNLAFETDFPPYDWDKRVRLPLPEKTLSRTLNGNFLYTAVRAHFSQGMLHNAKRIFNSDQVFWRRRTDVLTYRAKITVSSGDGSCLNDFKIADCPDILSLPAVFGASSWVPDGTDAKKEARVEFAAPQQVRRITLYGNAEEGSRVLAGKIYLGSGRVIPFGPLLPGAKANHIDLEKPETLSRFTVTLTETEGPSAGLTELEAYTSVHPKSLIQFVKLMADDTFAYDFWVRNKKDLPLQVYCYGEKGAETFTDRLPEGFRLICVEPENYRLDGLVLRPGSGFKQAVLRIESVTDPDVSDQIVIRCVSFFTWLHLKITQGIDAVMNRAEHVVKYKYYKLFRKEKRNLT